MLSGSREGGKEAKTFMEESWKGNSPRKAREKEKRIKHSREVHRNERGESRKMEKKIYRKDCNTL